jgi:hypothetical protein
MDLQGKGFYGRCAKVSMVLAHSRTCANYMDLDLNHEIRRNGFRYPAGAR